MMSVDQSAEDNKAEFVQRLVEAGWKKHEAEEEWERIQKEEEVG